MLVFSVPIAEIASTIISSAVIVLTARDLIRSKRTSSIFSDALSKRREWREFENDRMMELLKDKQLSEDDWKEILSLVEDIVSSETKTKGWKELRSIYPSRSEKAKKLLLSEVISKSSSRLDAARNSEAA